MNTARTRTRAQHKDKDKDQHRQEHYMCVKLTSPSESINLVSTVTVLSAASLNGTRIRTLGRVSPWSCKSLKMSIQFNLIQQQQQQQQRITKNDVNVMSCLLWVVYDTMEGDDKHNITLPNIYPISFFSFWAWTILALFFSTRKRVL